MMTSYLIRANKKSTSLKLTVPKDIIEALKVKDGSLVQWKIGEEKGEVYAKIKKLEVK